MATLTSTDVSALRALLAYTRSNETDRDVAYLCSLRQREAALGPAARRLWFERTADQLQSELAR